MCAGIYLYCMRLTYVPTSICLYGLPLFKTHVPDALGFRLNGDWPCQAVANFTFPHVKVPTTDKALPWLDGYIVRDLQISGNFGWSFWKALSMLVLRHAVISGETRRSACLADI